MSISTSVERFATTNIQFFTKEEVMRAARWLVETYRRRPESFKGTKFPVGLDIRGDLEHMSYTYIVTYYGIRVGTVDMESFRILYSV